MAANTNKKILVGIDYTKSSINALNYAAGLAQVSKSSLVLFHVYDFPVVHTNAGLYMVDYRSIKKDDLEKLEKLRVKIQAEHPKLIVETINSNISFRSYVEELAVNKKINYVVIGLETKSKISKFIWGTTGIDIAGKVDCPVIIVPEKYQHFKYENLVATIDYKQDLKKVVIRRAEKFAKEHKLNCELIHFQTDDELDFGLEAAELKKQAAHFNIKVVKTKNFNDGLKKYIAQNKTDLVVLFSRSHSAVYKLFNDTNTKAIAFNSNIPVMSIHG